MKKSFIFIALIVLTSLIIWGALQYDFEDGPNVQTERTVKVNSESKGNYDNDSISEKLSIYNLAADFVKKSLKEPATAEFPNTQEKLKHIEYLGSNRYRIDSWVDSRDTYAAMSRRNFSLIFKVNGSSVIKEKFIIEEYGYIPKK